VCMPPRHVCHPVCNPSLSLASGWGRGAPQGAQQERKSGSDSNNAGLPRGAGIRAFQQRVGILAIGVSFALTAAVEGALRAYIEHAKMAWPG